MTLKPADAISSAKGSPTYPRPITAAVALCCCNFALKVSKLGDLPSDVLLLGWRRRFEFLNMYFVFVDEFVEIYSTDAEVFRCTTHHASVSRKRSLNIIYFHRRFCKLQINV